MFYYKKSVRFGWRTPFSLLREIQARILKVRDITCKRGSAKHCVKDDFAFLWKHLNFGYPRNENFDQDNTLHSSLGCLKDPDCKNGEDGLAGHLHEWVKCNGFECAFLFQQLTYSPDRPSNIRTLYTRRCGLYLECAFWGSPHTTFIWGSYATKPPLFQAEIGISSINVESNNFRTLD